MDIWINTTCFYTFYQIKFIMTRDHQALGQISGLKSQLGDIEPFKFSSKGNAFPSNGEKSSESVRSLESF